MTTTTTTFLHKNYINRSDMHKNSVRATTPTTTIELRCGSTPAAAAFLGVSLASTNRFPSEQKGCKPRDTGSYRTQAKH